MRRVMCLIGALVICLTLAMPVFAATDTFVPSISYKDGPVVKKAQLDGENVTGCIVVTSIKGATEKTTDIYQKERDLLLAVYKELDDGTMTLPLENRDFVIRELVDISHVKTACVEAPHGHKEWLAEKDNVIEIVLNLGLKSTTEVEVLAYVDGEWAPIQSVSNNGDGTITCIFDELCPVAFCVDASAEEESPKTGDTMTDDWGHWAIVLAVASVAIALLVVNRRKILG